MRRIKRFRQSTDVVLASADQISAVSFMFTIIVSLMYHLVYNQLTTVVTSNHVHTSVLGGLYNLIILRELHLGGIRGNHVIGQN